MGFVGLKTNSKEEKEIEELETLLRNMDPLQKIASKSAVIKEAVRIALFHIKNTYFYSKGLTEVTNAKTPIIQTRYVARIPSTDIAPDGSRISKKG